MLSHPRTFCEIVKVISRELLLHLSREARGLPRLRKNYNLHSSDNSRCHRLLNAMEPASYIRPHRHVDQEKDEAFILMRGALGVIIFDDAGEVTETVLMSFLTGNLAVDIPHGVLHTAVCLEMGTVFCETKAGPYLSLNEEEKAGWAPEENTPLALSYLEKLRGVLAEFAV
ncbi:MAG: WbuC family cupin fold metalloprotein [Proteobacteria bacterium]|nr:cupin fold metalloprotein, WbuC family [Desulfobulbaceae bacterium]MBU4152933.1 WbuC family cupin fold metalloprotein [Pseudomonadota bacterium]